MADTQRSVSDIFTLLADNTTGAISAQDLRDAFLSWRPGYGQIYVAAADSAAVAISDTTNYFEVTAPAWTLDTPARLFDESDGNGKLTYTGAVAAEVRVTATVCMTSGSSNQVTHWRIGENGTPIAASEIQRKIGTGTDVGAVSLTLLTSMSPGENLSLWVRNSTGANNITVVTATLDATTVPL